jgi:hypothetical protein
MGVAGPEEPALEVGRRLVTGGQREHQVAAGLDGHDGDQQDPGEHT